MTSHVFVPEDTTWIHLTDQLEKIIESRIETTEVFRTKGMVFGPMRTTIVLHNDVCKALEIAAVSHWEIIGS